MKDDAKMVPTAADLDRVLEELQQVEVFQPPEEFAAAARIRDRGAYEEAERDPQGYWAGQARQLDWAQPFRTVLDDSDPPFYKWFADGTLNASYNCLDRHVEAGRGDRVAYHWRGEEGEERAITYADLHRDVQRLANGLKDLGVGKGDVVGIFLPMIPEVVVAMLACARIGAPHNVVFGGFSPSRYANGWRSRARRRSSRATAPGARVGPARSRARSTGCWPISRNCRASWWSATPARSARCRRGATSSTTTCCRPARRSARPSRCRRNTRCSSCTPPARRRSRRASCTPAAGT